MYTDEVEMMGAAEHPSDFDGRALGELIPVIAGRSPRPPINQMKSMSLAPSVERVYADSDCSRGCLASRAGAKRTHQGCESPTEAAGGGAKHPRANDMSC